MAQISNLVIGISANAEKFNKELKATQGNLDSFKKRLQDIAPGGNLVAGLVGGIAGGNVLGVFDTIKGKLGEVQAAAERGAASIKELGKFSRAFGISIESAVVLQKATGDTEALNTAMKTLADKLGEAQLGSESAAESFRKFGLDAKELQGIPLDQAVMRISDRYREMVSPLERVAMRTELLGKSSAAMLPLLEKGAAGWEMYAKQARRAGEMLSEVDAQMVANAAKAAQQAGGGFSETGKERTLAVKSAPFTELWNKGLVEGQAGLRAVKRELTESKGILGALGDVSGLSVLVGTMQQITDQARQRAAAEVETRKALQDQQAALAQQAAARGQFEDAMKGMADQAERAGRNMRVGINAEVEKLMASQRGRLGGVFSGLIDGLKAADPPLLQLIDKLEMMGATIEQINQAGEAFNIIRQMKEAGSAKFPGLPGALEVGSGAAVSAMNRMAAEREHADNQAKNLGELNQKAGQQIQVLERILKQLERPIIGRVDID